VAGFWAWLMVMTFTVSGGLGAIVVGVAAPTGLDCSPGAIAPTPSPAAMVPGDPSLTIAPPETPAVIFSSFSAAFAVTPREAPEEQPGISLSIAQARRWTGTAAVTLVGWVTVPSGQFASAMLDQGFALQDESGGLYISTQDATDFAVGEQIRVVGTVGDDGHGQRILQLHEWQRLPQTTEAISGMPAVPSGLMSVAAAQDLGGQLVTVQGRVSRPLVTDAPYGDRLWLADDSGEVQIYMPRSTDIRPEKLSWLEPGQPLQVTGLISQYDGNHEVIPRFTQDLQPWVKVGGG
jgi:hypothetical protein